MVWIYVHMIYLLESTQKSTQAKKKSTQIEKIDTTFYEIIVVIEKLL